MLFFSSEPSRRTRTQIRNEEGLHYDVRLLCRTEGQPLDEKIISIIEQDNRMSNNERKTSKIAIAGLIVSVIIPGLFFLCVLVFESFYKQLNGALEIFLLLLIVLPFIALPLSIAAVVIS